MHVRHVPGREGEEGASQCHLRLSAFIQQALTGPLPACRAEKGASKGQTCLCTLGIKLAGRRVCSRPTGFHAGGKAVAWTLLPAAFRLEAEVGTHRGKLVVGSFITKYSQFLQRHPRLH